MFILFCITNIILLSAAKEQESQFFNVGVDFKSNRGLSKTHETISKPLQKYSHNSTYMEKEENMLRIPNKYYEENKTKKKIKKPPKRTVQKIIKKNRYKTRKLYLFPATNVPTLASKSMFEDGSHSGQISTTENNSKKKSRKNQKYVRYQMPFQKLQKRDGTRSRLRREERDVYILKDFDEIKFFSKEKDQDKVLTHVQKYW